MQEDTKDPQQDPRHMSAGQSQQDVAAEEDHERHQSRLSRMRESVSSSQVELHVAEAQHEEDSAER